MTGEPDMIVIWCRHIRWGRQFFNDYIDRIPRDKILRWTNTAVANVQHCALIDGTTIDVIPCLDNYYGRRSTISYIERGIKRDQYLWCIAPGMSLPHSAYVVDSIDDIDRIDCHAFIHYGIQVMTQNGPQNITALQDTGQAERAMIF